MRVLGRACELRIERPLLRRSAASSRRLTPIASDVNTTAKRFLQLRQPPVRSQCRPITRGAGLRAHSTPDPTASTVDTGCGGQGASLARPGLGQPDLQFSADQLQNFSALRAAMQGYAVMSVAASGVSVAKVVLLIVATGAFQVPPSSAAYLIVHSVTAGIVWKAAGLLPRPTTPPERHEPLLMQSMRAMAVVFLQIGTMHWFVSAVTMMEAAITWPQLVTLFAAFVAATCLVRVSALSYVFDRYGQKQAAELHIDSFIGGPFAGRFKWLDRAAIMLVGGSLAGSQTARGGNQSIELGGTGAAGKPQYEFTPEEETTFSDLMDSIRDTGAATMLMCLGHFMHVIAKGFANDVSLLEQYASVTAGIEAGAMAGVMLYSVGCFGRILSTTGQDVRLLMKGISSDKGLSQLFQRLKKVQVGAAVGAFIPFAIDLGMKFARGTVDMTMSL